MQGDIPAEGKERKIVTKSNSKSLLASLPTEVLERLLKVVEQKVVKLPKHRKVDIIRNVEHHRHCIFCGMEDVIRYTITESYHKVAIPKDFMSPIVLDEDVVQCYRCYEILPTLPVGEIIAKSMSVITFMGKEWRGQRMPKRREPKG